MRLLFQPPADWRVTRDGDWYLITSPDQLVRVLSTPLVAVGDLDLRAILESDLPAGGRTETIASADGLTQSGWEFTLVTLCIRDAREVVVEQRLAAVVRMLPYAAVIIARTASTDRLDRDYETLLALFTSARPYMWNAEPVCVAEWFAMDEP